YRRPDLGVGEVEARVVQRRSCALYLGLSGDELLLALVERAHRYVAAGRQFARPLKLLGGKLDLGLGDLEACLCLRALGLERALVDRKQQIPLGNDGAVGEMHLLQVPANA